MVYNSNTRTVLRYHKVSKTRKEELIDLVFGENRSIVEASKMLKINYSTAKSIILNHKKKTLSSSSLESCCISSVTEEKEGNSTDSALSAEMPAKP